jgi:hypothetical protein
LNQAEVGICFQAKEEINLSARTANVNWKIMRRMAVEVGRDLRDNKVDKGKQSLPFYPLTGWRIFGRLRNCSDR